MANLLSLKLERRDVNPLVAEGDGPEQRLRRTLDDALMRLRDAKPFESYASSEARGGRGQRDCREQSR
ncbi:hypothetical protein ACFQ36_03665 [Arthrobacter sp. GCM10027362]